MIEVLNPRWALTTEGLASLGRPYRIDQDRLLDTSEGWPQHMLGKIWVDCEQLPRGVPAVAALLQPPPLRGPGPGVAEPAQT